MTVNNKEQLVIIYENSNITQIAMINCMKNNIITISKSPEIREQLFGKCSQSTIKINGKDYEITSDIHIDIDTSNIYIDEYPNYLEKIKPKVVILIICYYSEINLMMLDILKRHVYKKRNTQYYIVASRFSQTN